MNSNNSDLKMESSSIVSHKKDNVTPSSGMVTSPDASSNDTSENLTNPQSHALEEKQPDNVMSVNPANKDEQSTGDVEGILQLSGQHVKMIDNALDSMAHEGNSVNDADDNDVNRNDDSENQVQRKWPELKSAHIMTQKEINSHNSYIDNSYRDREWKKGNVNVH